MSVALIGFSHFLLKVEKFKLTLVCIPLLMYFDLTFCHEQQWYMQLALSIVSKTADIAGDCIRLVWPGVV